MYSCWGFGVLFLSCVCVVVGGVVLCRCVCVCDLLVFLYVFLWRSHRNTNRVFRLVYPCICHECIRIQGSSIPSRGHLWCCSCRVVCCVVLVVCFVFDLFLFLQNRLNLNIVPYFLLHSTYSTCGIPGAGLFLLVFTPPVHTCSRGCCMLNTRNEESNILFTFSLFCEYILPWICTYPWHIRG